MPSQHILILPYRQRKRPVRLAEHDCLGLLRYDTKIRLHFDRPKVCGREEDDKENGHHDQKSRDARYRIPHRYDGVVGPVAVSFNHLFQILTGEEHPGEDTSHQTSVEKVEGKADFAEPEEEGEAEYTAHVRGADDGKAKELDADGGPEAAYLGVFWGDFLEPVVEDGRPGGQVLVFGGEGHENEGYDGERGGEDGRIFGEAHGVPSVVYFRKEDASKDVRADQS